MVSAEAERNPGLQALRGILVLAVYIAHSLQLGPRFGAGPHHPELLGRAVAVILLASISSLLFGLLEYRLQLRLRPWSRRAVATWKQRGPLSARRPQEGQVF